MRLAIRIVIILVFILGLFALSAPFLAKHYVLAWLDEKDYDADINRVGLNILTSTLTINGVRVENGEGEVVTVFEAIVPVNFPALLQNRLSLGTVEVSGARVDIKKTEQGFQIAGLPVSQWLPAGEDNGWTLDIKRLGLSNLSLCRSIRNQCLRVESAAMTNVRMSRENGERVFKSNSSVSISKMFFRDQDDGSAIFYLSGATAAAMTLSESRISARDLTLSNFQLVETPSTEKSRTPEAPYQTQLASLSVDTATLDRGTVPKLTLGKISIESLRQALQKNSDAVFVMPDRIKAWFPELEGFFNAEKRRVDLVVAELQVTGGVLSWLDYSVTPPAVENLNAIRVSTGAINSQNPNLQTVVSVHAKVGERGAVQMQGDIELYNPLANYSFTGFIRSFDLSRLSAYSSYLLGQKLVKGVVDASLDLSAIDNQLDAETVWAFTDFELVSGTANPSPYMSMQRAISLLEDTSNSVQVTLNIEGDIVKDDITLQKVFSQYLRKELNRMAKNRQNPINAQAIPSIKSAKPGKMTFSSIIFESNKIAPSMAAKKHITDIAQKLKSKSYLKMVFCPVSTGGEWSSLYNGGREADQKSVVLNEQKTALLKLGEERGQMVKNLLLAQGVSAAQVDICGPSLQMEESGPSYVSVAL